MALKIELKPEERLYIGEHVLINGNDRRMKLVVETKSRMLRESEMLFENDAVTLCGKLQVAMQQLYLATDPTQYHLEVERIATDIAAAEPGFEPMLAEISQQIQSGRYYHALKSSRLLRERESVLLALVQAAE